MIKKHAIVYSAVLHILLVALFVMFKLERRQELDERPIYLEYEFTDKLNIDEGQESEMHAAVKKIDIPLPPVVLPQEKINEPVTSEIIADKSFEDVQSLVIMPEDSLTALDSILLINPNLLTLRTFFMDRISGSLPEDTSKKWKPIIQIGMDEYLKKLRYSDEFKNALLQEKFNSGGIRFSLDSIFDLFGSNKDTVINFNNLPSGIRAYRDPGIYSENKNKK